MERANGVGGKTITNVYSSNPSRNRTSFDPTFLLPYKGLGPAAAKRCYEEAISEATGTDLSDGCSKYHNLRAPHRQGTKAINEIVPSLRHDADFSHGGVGRILNVTTYYPTARYVNFAKLVAALPPEFSKP